MKLFRSKRRPALLRAGAAAAAVIATGICAGCNSHFPAIDPASPQAHHIKTLWWTFTYVCTTVYVLVLIWLLFAIWRGRKTRAAEVAAVLPSHPDSPGEHRTARLVSAAVSVTGVILFGLLVCDFAIGRELRPPQTTDALSIQITGHQWWWQVEYDEPIPSNNIVTANEIHLPVGRPVQLNLQSTDVIHSFWIPNLQGKKDLIPGKQTILWLTPERIGTFRGQCAEFCGLEHAKMGLSVVVESPENFARWQEAQRKSAAPPATDSARRGQQVFLNRTCVMCHTVQGTPANSRVGPPLTHLASRQTIAAGSYPNTRGHLAGWILDPQAMKPGVRMPPNSLSPDELQDLLDYLATLK